MFEVVVAEVTELPPAEVTKNPVEYAERMASLKADKVAESYPKAIVIGADTIVTHGRDIIGKPADENHARHILANQFGGGNDVITGLAVLCLDRQVRVITHEVTTLVMRAMTKSELEDYLKSGLWRGKAGAYGFKEDGDPFVQSICGSKANIVGLPLAKLEEILSQFK